MIKRFDFHLPGKSTIVDSLNIEEPSQCPMCKHDISPKALSCIFFDEPPRPPAYVVAFGCTHCHRAFIAQYDDKDSNYQYLAPVIPEKHEFEPEVQKLSPSFVDIYNQAEIAEASGLTEICGIGYRKSLEFLIKDYLISLADNDEEIEAIKHMQLGNCIANKVANAKLKAVAQRATWIGNDFTHYTRKFNEYEISDLKRFIAATLHWIQMEIVTDEALAIAPRR